MSLIIKNKHWYQDWWPFREASWLWNWSTTAFDFLTIYLQKPDYNAEFVDIAYSSGTYNPGKEFISAKNLLFFRFQCTEQTYSLFHSIIKQCACFPTRLMNVRVFPLSIKISAQLWETKKEFGHRTDTTLASLTRQSTSFNNRETIYNLFLINDKLLVIYLP